MRKSISYFTTAFLAVASVAHAQSLNLNDAPVPSAGGQNIAEFIVEQMQKGTLVDVDTESSTRIYGGRPAQTGAWPAQVGLHLTQYLSNDPKDKHSSHFCGGSIIARQWVLTAAHCVVQGDGVMPADALAVRSGSTKITAGDFRRVVRIIAHEDYDPIRINNDIALLQLSEPIGDSSGPVGAISVAPQGQQAPRGASVVIGWGKNENGQIPIDLLETDIDIIDNATCNRGMGQHMARGLAGQLIDFGQRTNIPESKLDEAFTVLVNAMGDMITENMICAGIPSGKRTSCQGDSGGPLMVKLNNGKWQQVGIVSFGATSANSAGQTVCGIEQTYAVYTRLSNYFNWIAKHVRGG